MGKHSKEAKEKEVEQEQEASTAERPEYDELAGRVNAIARPLAGKKLTKRIYKTVKKGEFYLEFSGAQSCLNDRAFVDAAAKAKSLRRGVKEVQKCIRKGEKG